MDSLRLALAAAAVYLLGAACLIAQRPGLQYDEALLVLGAVHARHDPGLPTYAHDPDTWICPRGRCLPLMTMRYVGAVKDWVCWPLFSLSDSRTLVVRAVSAAFGALGIVGVVMLVGACVGQRAAAAVGFVLSLNPSYADLTAFDNGTVSPWMAAMGLLALAGAAHVRAPSWRTAFAIGAAAGFGIWARANFVWLLLGVALTLVLLARHALPGRHLLAGFAGGLVGGAPFLLYNLISRGGTLGATQFTRTDGTWPQLLQARAIMFSEVMLANREHRAMWDAGPLPVWQAALPGGLAVAGLLVCLLSRDRWMRAAGVLFLGTAVWFFTSRLAVAEHHLIALLPLAAICVVLAAQRFPRVGLAAGVVYAACALTAYGQEIAGLARTGGTGQWSNAIVEVARHVDRHQRGKLIKILDWGLENNLYVLLDGRLKWRNIYPDATETLSEGRRPWIEELREGGVYLLNGPDNRQFPLASEVFLRTLAASQAKVNRQAFHQRDGRVFAELIEVEPGTARDLPAPIAPAFEGVHAPEASGWRWTERRFKVRWDRAARRVVLRVHVPELLLGRLGPLKLDGQELRESRQYTIERAVPETAREAVFTLDKFLAAGTVDARELGVVLVSATVE